MARIPRSSRVTGGSGSASSRVSTSRVGSGSTREAYSPYHQVKDGTGYPGVLLLTGENDGRVNPAHSRKMAARLQAATASRRPVLLRTSASTGHGLGTPLEARMAELADVYSFLFDQLDVF